jgi:putative transposase
MKLVEPTLRGQIIAGPAPTKETPHHLALDKGYDRPALHDLVEAWVYTAYIRARGEESAQQRESPGYHARQWVVERTHSWMNGFRRLLILWEKKAENYLAILHFARAWICFHSARLFG